MNARGIPTAAYQVLHLLPEVGYPPPAGVPPWPGPTEGEGVPEVGYPLPAGGTPWLDLAGVAPPPAGPGPGRGTPPPTNGWMNGQTCVKT